MSEAALSRQVADQCRVVAHLAEAIAKVHADYAKLAESPAFADILEQVGRRSASLMERLGDVLNGMDATSAEDDWTYPVFREAQRLFPTTEAAPARGLGPEAGYPAGARPLSEWTEEDGNVLWWRFPIEESPYVGSPLDLGHQFEVIVRRHMQGDEISSYDLGGWPGYHTHWTRIPMPEEPPAQGMEAGTAETGGLSPKDDSPVPEGCANV